MIGDEEWYTVKEFHPIGPMSKSDLLTLLPEVGGEKALVFSPGMDEWMEAGKIQELKMSNFRNYLL